MTPLCPHCERSGAPRPSVKVVRLESGAAHYACFACGNFVPGNPDADRLAAICLRCAQVLALLVVVSLLAAAWRSC